MLVLTRRAGQDIVIGENALVFKILAIKGSYVEIGVEFSDKKLRIPVYRGEAFRDKVAKDHYDNKIKPR